MGLQPGNPVVGGINLRIPAIQSPGFVSGVSGWHIDIDGSAEFNNVTVRGTIEIDDGTGNLFAYQPSAAAGNLFATISNTSGTDRFGNAFIAGIITYSTIAGLAVAQGSQAGAPVFATAATQAGPYTVASGPLRSIGSYQNGFTSGLDVNGNSYPVTLTQTDANSIEMAGRIVTPAGWVSGLVFGNIGLPFLLPAAGANIPEFPTVNAAGAATGSIVLRPNGNLAIFSNTAGAGFTMLTAGTFHF